MKITYRVEKAVWKPVPPPSHKIVLGTVKDRPSFYIRALKCEIESHHLSVELKQPEYSPPNDHMAKERLIQHQS